MKILTSIGLAVVVSFIVWLLSRWLLSFPSSLVPFSKFPILLALSLVTVLLLYAFNKFAGKPVGFLAEALVLAIVGFGTSAIVATAFMCFDCPNPALATVDCDFIGDKQKIVQPYPVVVFKNQGVEWDLSAKDKDTNILFDSFHETDEYGNPKSSKQPFNVASFSEKTKTKVGNKYKGNISAKKIINVGYYKFKVTCNGQSIDPMIWVPR
jgi:hypothetical protein